MMLSKKYLSVFLLVVFTWVLLPPAFVHQVFADHHDTECDFKHRHEVATVEPLHIHCSIFTTNAPIYNAPELVAIVKPARLLIAQFNSPLHFSWYQVNYLILPARAPPLT